jgi:hypothetical protein
LPVLFADERRKAVMRKWISIFLALALLAVFSFGCAGVSKDTKIKCPKCGAVFTIDEGLAEVQKKGY